jgi:3-dehydroquinate dehydratase-1
MTDSKAPKIVGVIFCRADFQRALRMRNPPDLFELRLDFLAGHLSAIENGITRLPAPLILTARHPREGGANDLPSRERQNLLLRFMAQARYMDIELRSARALAGVVEQAVERGIRLIASLHDFNGTPTAHRLDQGADLARSLGADIFKIATRTDTPAQLERLVDFFDRRRRNLRVAAMGMGNLGRISRLEFARRGCPLNYAHLGTAKVAGQLSIRELRRALA